MLSGRSNETKYLENCYAREGSQLLVVYGREGVGKTSLLMDFIKDKQADYYLARVCDETEQLKFMSIQFECEPTYTSVFQKLTSDHCRKKIVIIDEFQNMIKGSKSFMQEVIGLIHDKWNNQSVMVILSSSAFSWVENTMVSQIGDAAYEISGFLKVKELSFLELVRSFPKYSVVDCVGIYSILGGVPGLWHYFDDNISLKENICRTILNKYSVLGRQACAEIEEKLREPVVYYTILSRLAAGEDKLNELYASTNYSRAKISVYLKNLMELEIVEKVYSFETEGHDNTRKGIYRIQNCLVLFYFKYVFPHLSELEVGSPEEFYEKYIAESLRSFENNAYKKVCIEFMELMNQTGGLPVKVDEFYGWCGKVGDIDLIGQDENGRTIAGICAWDKDIMNMDDYEWLLFCLKQAKLKADYIYMFSGKAFDEKLISVSKEINSLKLIDPSMF